MLSTRLKAAVIASSGATLSSGALPAFGSASTAVTNGILAGTHGINYPATLTAGDLLLAVGGGKNNNGDATIAAHADLLAAGFTALVSGDTGNGNVAATILWKLAVGDEEEGTAIANAFTATGGVTSDGIRTQMFRFTAADGFKALPIVDAHLHTDADNFDTSVSMPTVTPTGANQLAVTVIISSGTGTIGAATGESNGDWTLDHSAAANNVGITVQSSDQSSGNAISGGTATATASTLALAFGMSLVPADV